nr:replication dependent histone H2A [Hymenolepis microstoma]
MSGILEFKSSIEVNLSVFIF